MVVPVLRYFEYKTVIEEIAKVCGSIGLSLAAHNSLCTGHILTLQTKNRRKNIYQNWQQQNGWRMGINRSQYRSDAGNMKCTAVKDGNDWIINGTKNWITHGKSGDIAVVICRTGEPRQKIMQLHL